MKYYRGIIIFSYNINTKQFKQHEQVLTNNITSFFKDKNQVVWGLTNKGLLQIDIEKKKSYYPPNVDLNHPIYRSEINHVFENNEGLWVASYEGLYLVNHSGVVLRHFELLDSYHINDCLQISNDEFWFTTKGKGLLNWNKAINQLKRFTIKDGLPHDYLYSIDKDEFGIFWIPTNNGLMRFNPSNNSINIFNEGDGLTNNEFNTYSRFVDDDGRIYLGGVNGMVGIEAIDFNYLDEVNLPLRILSYTKTKIEGEEVVDKIVELSNQKVIHFYPEDKSIDFTFSMIDFNNNIQSKYAYQIEGYDKSWNLLKENHLKISRLPYGNYQLKVKGQNRFGKWSDEQVLLPMIVEKPFYKKSWFYLLSIFSLGGIIFGLFRYRLYRLEKEKLRLEIIVGEN